MEKLPMCRICLVEDVRMYVVVNKNLHELYEKLTDAPFFTKDSRPILACFFCCTKLKQCWRFLRKCLEAEELFAQVMNEDCEAKPLIKPEHLNFFNGFVNSPIEHISIGDGGQTESDAIKAELPAVWERLDEIIDPEKKLQTNELKLESDDNGYADAKDTPAHHSESDSEDDEPVVDIEMEDEQESSELEVENVDNSYAAFKDTPAHHSESNSDDDEPMMKFKTKVEDEQESKGSPVMEKPKHDTRRAKLEDISSLQMKIKNSRKLVFASKIIQKTQNHTGGKPFKCDICQRRFAHKSQLTVHIRTHTGEKPFKCDICQRSFGQSNVLTRHIRTHTGEKLFKCDICQRSFAQKTNLTGHIRVHTREKPFKCDICQRSFAQKTNLTGHIRVHTREKPLKCDICQRSFPVKSKLTMHIRTHTGEKPFKCDICQRSFAQKTNLTSHIRVHTREKPLR